MPNDLIYTVKTKLLHRLLHKMIQYDGICHVYSFCYAKEEDGIKAVKALNEQYSGIALA